MRSPNIDIPSPQEILAALFKSPSPTIPVLPRQWNAQMLLTPFGGLGASALGVGDQLVVANISYDASRVGVLLMRANLYLLEGYQYYDFLFATVNGITTWYWLVSDPSKSAGQPSAAYGPFTTQAQVPSPDFLTHNNFSYVGNWDVVGKPCCNFAANNPGKPGTWFSFDAKNGTLLRIMNVDFANEYKVVLLGAYYLANVFAFSAKGTSDLQQLSQWCQTNARASDAPSPMITLQDIDAALKNPPTGFQIPCSLQNVQTQIPGIYVPAAGALNPPAWTPTVEISCYMIGQDAYPYFSRVWYDWGYGYQLTVFVQRGNGNDYDARLDELLPKGKAGPGVQYNWDGVAWAALCSDPQGSFVSMPRPDFVKAGNGQCRAAIPNHPLFSGRTITIWSVALGNAQKWSDFWYWFDDQSRGIVFSLAPASSLTMIDYQTFAQNALIKPDVFDEPANLPRCGANLSELKKKIMLVPK